MALFLRTSSTVTCTPPQALGFAGRVGQVVELELHLPAGHEGVQLAVERGDFLDVARRQLERQHDFGRLRAGRHFHVEHRLRLSHGQLAAVIGRRLAHRRPAARSRSAAAAAPRRLPVAA